MTRLRLFVVLLVSACSSLPLVVDGGSDASPDDGAPADDVSVDVVEASSVDVTTDAAIDVVVDATTSDAPADATPDVLDASVEASLVTLANAGNPYQMALDSTNVYWSDTATRKIMKCAIGGCGGTPDVLGAGSTYVKGLAIDSTNVYYEHDYSITKCALGGCDAGTDLVSGNSGYVGGDAVAVDSSNAYFFSSGSSNLSSCAIGGCSGTPKKVTAVAVIRSMLVLGSTLYWAENGAISSCPTTGCATPTTIAGVFAFTLKSDGTNLYWADNSGGKVLACAVGGCGGTPTIIASGQSAPFAVVSDGTYVYWSNFGTGTIMKCTITGCVTPTQIASGQNHPCDIAVDGTSVYWINNFGGEIQKLTPK